MSEMLAKTAKTSSKFNIGRNSTEIENSQSNPHNNLKVEETSITEIPKFVSFVDLKTPGNVSISEDNSPLVINNPNINFT